MICVRVNPSIRRINDDAFMYCSQLAIVTLGKWLEEIRERAFSWCTSLHEIVIPPAVRKIQEKAFAGCSQLAIVILGKGLEVIWEDAFCKCTSLQCIVIPPTVRVIHKEAFNKCSKLTNVRFCDEIFLVRGWRRWGSGHFRDAHRFVKL